MIHTIKVEGYIRCKWMQINGIELRLMSRIVREKILEASSVKIAMKIMWL